MLDKVKKMDRLAGKVLLIEDNPVNQLVMEGMLEKMGIAIEKADNGQQGIEMWRNGDFDVIIMDVQMPLMNGLEATQHIRAQEQDNEHQIIIAITANVFAEDEKACKQAGVDAYLTKPVDIEVLYETMSQYLQIT